jgi:hypothetical protein
MLQSLQTFYYNLLGHLGGQISSLYSQAFKLLGFYWADDSEDVGSLKRGTTIARETLETEWRAERTGTYRLSTR